MSPLASAKVLPCSEDSSRARSSYSFCTSSRNLNMHPRAPLRIGRGPAGERGLRIGDGVLDLGCLASATLACTSPVLGSNTSPERPEVPLTSLPPMKWPISRMDVLPGNCTAPRPPALAYCAAFFAAVTGVAGHGHFGPKIAASELTRDIAARRFPSNRPLSATTVRVRPWPSRARRRALGAVVMDIATGLGLLAGAVVRHRR